MAEFWSPIRQLENPLAFTSCTSEFSSRFEFSFEEIFKHEENPRNQDFLVTTEKSRLVVTTEKSLLKNEAIQPSQSVNTNKGYMKTNAFTSLRKLWSSIGTKSLKTGIIMPQMLTTMIVKKWREDIESCIPAFWDSPISKKRRRRTTITISSRVTRRRRSRRSKTCRAIAGRVRQSRNWTRLAKCTENSRVLQEQNWSQRGPDDLDLDVPDFRLQPKVKTKSRRPWTDVGKTDEFPLLSNPFNILCGGAQCFSSIRSERRSLEVARMSERHSGINWKGKNLLSIFILWHISTLLI